MLSGVNEGCERGDWRFCLSARLVETDAGGFGVTGVARGVVGVERGGKRFNGWRRGALRLPDRTARFDRCRRVADDVSGLFHQSA